MSMQVKSARQPDSPWVDGIVIGTGFFPIAMAFGMIAKDFGFSFLETSLCSILVFAGASQFAAVGMLSSGGGILDVVFLVWLVNMRHFLMGMSLMSVQGHRLKKFKPLLGFGLTDESYTFLSLSKKNLTASYAVIFQMMTYLSWVTGTMSGYLLVEYIPEKISMSLDIALYGMFAALATMTVKRDPENLWLILLAGGIHQLFIWMHVLNSSWRLMAAMTIAAFIGSVFFRHHEAPSVEPQ